MTTQPGYDDGSRPNDDGSNRPDGQPWDPAYPHPMDPQASAYPSPADPNPNPSPAYRTYPQPYGYPYSAAYGAPLAPQPPEPPRRRPRRRGLMALGAGAVAAATVVAVAVASGTTQSVNGTAAASANGSSGSSSTAPGGTNGGSSGGSSTDPGNGNFPFPGNGSSGNGSGNGSVIPGNGTSSSGTATATQQVGVVDVVTVLKYQSAAAAGTGMVLTSDGEILTNNHVIDGATSIKVTVVSTGKTYVAKVVGTVPTKDIAVLKLVNASGLKTANLGNSSTVSVGDSVTGVGNAGGTGGTPSAAKGKVTALNKTITASDQDGSSSETLHNVIVTDAPIQSGDSGGPLYNAKDEVIGIDTAASTSGTSVGFAIPINTALSIVAQIEKGIETSSVHIGYPGFMGISLSPRSTQPLVSSVLQGGPADKAGIGAGDVITKVGSSTTSTATQLQKAVSSHEPGSKVSITYTDPSTGSHSVSVTLATGPAD